MTDPFAAAWDSNRPAALLAAPHELKHRYGELWVRFHCLPDSKRYAESAAEVAEILGRYNTVLDELFGGGEVCVVRAQFGHRGAPRRFQRVWRTVVDGVDPEFGPTRAHLFLTRHEWRSGLLDAILLRVADDRESGVLIADLDARRLFHPYDGGMDVIAATTEARDALRDRHRDWLSRHPQGL